MWDFNRRKLLENMMGWLNNLFGGKESEEDAEDQPLEEINDDAPFVITEHMRIVAAIIVMILSAFAMWWILA